MNIVCFDTIMIHKSPREAPAGTRTQATEEEKGPDPEFALQSYVNDFCCPNFAPLVAILLKKYRGKSPRCLFLSARSHILENSV